MIIKSQTSAVCNRQVRELFAKKHLEPGDEIRWPEVERKSIRESAYNAMKPNGF